MPDIPPSNTVPLKPRSDQPGDRCITEVQMTVGRRRCPPLVIDIDVRGAERGPAEIIEMPAIPHSSDSS